MKKTNLILILCLFNLIHARGPQARSLYQREFISNLSSYGPVIPTSDKLPCLKRKGKGRCVVQLTADKYTQNCENNWNVCFWGKGQPNNIAKCDSIYKDQNGNFLNTCFYNTSWS